MSFTPNSISQRDPRWINEKLGFDDTATIGTDGSTLACLAMLVNGYGFDETPSSLNRKLKDLGSGVGFLGSLIVWPGLTEGFPNIVFRGINICRDQPAPMSDINASLDAGQPLVIELDQSPSAGLQNHWVIIYARLGDDYLMLDPWPQPPDDAPAKLGDRYGQGRPASEYITSVAWYAASSSPASATRPATAPGIGLFVRVQAIETVGVTLRSAPDSSATAVAVEPPGTLLHCIEPDAIALPRIGVTDQWLQVSDPGGLDGYVAAWYVDKADKIAPQPQEQPAPSPASASTSPLEPALPATPAPTPSAGPALSPTPAPTPPPEQVQPAMASPTHPPEPPPPPTSVSTPSPEPLQPAASAINPPPEPALPATPAPASPSAPTPAPASLTVRVLQTIRPVGLRLRDQPDTTSNTMAILSAGQELTVLEPAEQAIPKIGQINQWINVRDGNGQIGYVAAWYVESGNPPAPEPASRPSSASSTLTVFVSSQASGGLRMRDQPNASGSLLKVLMPGTPLEVLESASATRAKVGVKNQWLNVREPSGAVGYVAAWYVTG